MADLRTVWTYINENNEEVTEPLTIQQKAWAALAPPERLLDPQARSGKSIRSDGWWDEIVDGNEHNWQFALKSRLLAELEQRGIMFWSALTNYDVPGIVWGSDSNLYIAIDSSGPDKPLGVKDPVTQTAPLAWNLIDLNSSEGEIVIAPHELQPAGTLACDGANYLVSEYPELYAKIGVIYGGLASVNFNVPDYRGYTLRGSGNITLDKGADVSITGTCTDGNIHILSVSSFANLEVGMQLYDWADGGETLTIPPNTFITGFRYATALITGTPPIADAIILNDSLGVSPGPSAPFTLYFTNRLDRGDGTLGDAVGTKQFNGVGAHKHPVGFSDRNATVAGSGFKYKTTIDNSATNTASTLANAMFNNFGADTRPDNVSVAYFIRYI